MTSSPYRLRCLGGLFVAPEHTALGQRKRLILLAILAYAGRSGISKERVESFLWPESDGQRARNGLYQLVFGIRRELGEGAIVSVNNELRLGVDVLTSDIGEFRHAIESGDLEGAIGCYAGSFLDGVQGRESAELDQWIEVARRELEARYHETLECLSVRASLAGRRDDAVRWTRKRAVSEPLSTRAAIAHIRALDAVGDRAASLLFAQTHAALIRTQLETEPGDEFEHVVAALKAPARLQEPSRLSIPLPTFAHAAVVETGETLASSGASSLVIPEHRRRLYLRRAAIGILVVTVATAFARETPSWTRPDTFKVGAIRQLTTGQSVELEPAISPDGKLIAYTAGPEGQRSVVPTVARIFVRSVAGGRAVALAPDFELTQRHPRWSPDGSRIAFQTVSGIFVVPALGGPVERTVADSGRVLGMGSWSPDGRSMAFTDSSGVWVQDLVTGTARLVTRAEFQPTSVSWSPDGKLLAYVVGTGSMMNIAPSSIWLVAPWGGKPVRITDLIHLNTSPVFAPDSRSLLYVSNRDGVRDIYQQSIGHGVQAAGDAVRLSIGSNAVTISLSGDGTRMSYGVLNMRSNLWSAPITVGGHPPDSSLRALTSGNQEVECLSVTDDGRWLIFDSNKGGNQDIYRMPVGGGEAVQLTNDAADDFCGKASPDGKEIAFYSMRDQGRRRIHTMRFDGTRQRALPATTGHAWSPTWSRDGNRIAFTSNSNGHDEIYVVARRPDGDWTGPRLLASVVGAGHSVVWSPDDKYIAAGTDSSIVLLPTRAADPRISIDLPPDHEHFVGPGMTALAKWGPDPTKLYIRRPGGPGVIGEFWIASLSGGAPRLALKLDTAKVISRRGEFATDGKRIFFTLATDEANVWLMELKR